MRKQSNLVLTIISCIAVLLVVAFITSNAALKDTYAADPLEGEDITCVVKYDDCVNCKYSVEPGESMEVEANVVVYVNGNPVSNPSKYIYAAFWKDYEGKGIQIQGRNSGTANDKATMYVTGKAGDYIIGGYFVKLTTGNECGRYEDTGQSFQLRVIGESNDDNCAPFPGLDDGKVYQLLPGKSDENPTATDFERNENLELIECSTGSGTPGSGDSGSSEGAGCYKKDGVSKWYTSNPGAGYAKDGDGCYVCYTCETEDNGLKYCWSYPEGADANCTKTNLTKEQCLDTSIGYYYCYQCTVNGEAVFEVAEKPEDAAKAVNGTDCEKVVAKNCRRGCYGCTVNGSQVYTMTSSVSSAAVLTGGTNCQEVANSYCSTNPSDNPKTGGTIAIIVAWILAGAAIGYTFWYFKKSNSLNEK